MANLKDRIEKAALELADARERFEHAQENFDSLIAMVSEQAKGSDPDRHEDNPVQNGPKNGPLTNPEKVMRVLNSIPRKAWNYDELVAEIPSIKKSAMRVIIYNLKKNNKVTSEEYGTFKSV